MRNRLPILISLILLLVFSTLAVFQPPKTYYPTVDVELSDPAGKLTLSFLFESRPSIKSCEALIGGISRVMLQNCPTCSARQPQCLDALSTDQKLILSASPVDAPTGRLPNGVVRFLSASPQLGVEACRMTERQARIQNAHVECFAANTPRPKNVQQNYTGPAFLPWLIPLAALAAAWLTVWLILKYEHLHAHLSHDHVDAGPQKYHEFPTPRVGGLAIMSGLLVGSGILLLFDVPQLAEREFGLLLLASAPAFLGGLVEDLTKKVGVLERLTLTMLAGSIGAWLLGAILNRLDLPGVDAVLTWLPLAVALTMFAVGGIANAINIIDGYNGLAGGFAIIVLCGLAYVGYQTGDHLIFLMALGLAGAVQGFLLWNWPAGRIFMGDGGAYLLGFMLAELSVLLVVRNPTVSPWFPLALLIYPVFETFYSIYRRKVRNGLSPGQPDNQHLHQLIHDHLVTRDAQAGKPSAKLADNSRVAKYFWAPAVAMTLLASGFWSSTPALMLWVIGFCAFYVFNYQRLLRRNTQPNTPPA